MAFTTSGQETEWAYSYSPVAHTGLILECLCGERSMVDTVPAHPLLLWR